jgi:hypothetical protein
VSSTLTGVVFSQFIARDSRRVHNSLRPRRFADLCNGEPPLKYVHKLLPAAVVAVNATCTHCPDHLKLMMRRRQTGEILFFSEKKQIDASHLINCFRVQEKAAKRNLKEADIKARKLKFIMGM